MAGATPAPVPASAPRRSSPISWGRPTSDAGAPLLRKSSAAQGCWFRSLSLVSIATPLLRKSLAAQGSCGPAVGPSSQTRWLLLVQQEQETLLARRTLAIALG